MSGWYEWDDSPIPPYERVMWRERCRKADERWKKLFGRRDFRWSDATNVIAEGLLS